MVQILGIEPPRIGTGVLSIVVCTFQRADELAITLAAVSRCVRPLDLETELVVVSNDCRRKTRRIAEAAGARVIDEPRIGLSFARNTAIAHTRGEAILFLDDDVTPDIGLLKSYAEALKDSPEAQFFGGPIRAEFTSRTPTWVESARRVMPSIWSIRDLGELTRALQPGERPFGANMLIRRTALKGGFRTDLGRSGETGLGSGEETVLFDELERGGARGRWIADAGVNHRIGSNRLTLGYIGRYHRAQAMSRLHLGGRVLGDQDSLLRLNARIVHMSLAFLITRTFRNPERWLDTWRLLNEMAGLWLWRYKLRKKKGDRKCQTDQG